MYNTIQEIHGRLVQCLPWPWWTLKWINNSQTKPESVKSAFSLLDSQRPASLCFIFVSLLLTIAWSQQPSKQQTGKFGLQVISICCRTCCLIEVNSALKVCGTKLTVWVDSVEQTWLDKNSPLFLFLFLWIAARRINFSNSPLPFQRFFPETCLGLGGLYFYPQCYTRVAWALMGLHGRAPIIIRFWRSHSCSPALMPEEVCLPSSLAPDSKLTRLTRPANKGALSRLYIWCALQTQLDKFSFNTSLFIYWGLAVNIIWPCFQTKWNQYSDGSHVAKYLFLFAKYMKAADLTLVWF